MGGLLLATHRPGCTAVLLPAHAVQYLTEIVNRDDLNLYGAMALGRPDDVNAWQACGCGVLDISMLCIGRVHTIAAVFTVHWRGFMQLFLSRHTPH